MSVQMPAGSFGKLRALLLATPGASTLWLASRGGNFIEALKIGRLTRTLNLEVWAPMSKMQWVSLKDPANNTCSSACFFIYAAGAQRQGGYVGVHRPYLSREDYQGMQLEQAAEAYSWIEAQTAAYLKEMGVLPKSLQMIMATNSEEMLWLSEEDLDGDFTGIIKEYDDWFRAVCPHLSATQIAEDERLRQRGLRKVELTEQELAFRVEVDKIQSANIACTSAQLRILQERNRQTMLTKVLSAEAVVAPGLQNGFGGLTWGSRPADDMTPVSLSAAAFGGFQTYFRRDTPRVANREPAFIVYAFDDGALCRVMVGFDGSRNRRPYPGRGVNERFVGTLWTVVTKRCSDVDFCGRCDGSGSPASRTCQLGDAHVGGSDDVSSACTTWTYGKTKRSTAVAPL